MGVRKILAAFLSIFIIILLLSGGIFLFSTQIINLSTKISDFQDKILQVCTKATLFFNNYLRFLPTVEEGELITRLKSWVGQSAGLLVSKTFNNSAAFPGGLVSTIIFTFLVLIYRNGFCSTLGVSCLPNLLVF